MLHLLYRFADINGVVKQLHLQHHQEGPF
jgi:hypothetical protein